MSGQPPGYTGNAGGRFIGGLMMALGGLIAGLSGLCTLGFAVMMVAEEPHSAGAFLSGLPIVAIVGGVPIAVGLGLFFVGRSIYRSSKPKPDPQTFT